MDRSKLLMIKGAPFNAETPLEGLRELITPTPLPPPVGAMVIRWPSPLYRSGSGASSGLAGG